MNSFNNYILISNTNKVNMESYYIYYLFIVTAFLTILLSIRNFAPGMYSSISEWVLYLKYLFSGVFGRLKINKSVSNIPIETLVEKAGYSYDSRQDIFYSNLYTWQRNMGYCRLYDKAAAPLSMIIDSEPIYFEYDDRRWLIEFWKGQYGMTMGGEVGIYVTDGPDLKIPGVFNGTFYNCASDEDLLPMSITLKKSDQVVFKRSRPHWWITGFKLGQFAYPIELTMIVFITLKNETMRDAYLGGLLRAGYLKDELLINGNTVGLLFGVPRTRQPITRTRFTDVVIQKRNKLLCDRFQEATMEYKSSWNKLEAVQENSPQLLYSALNIGKTAKLFGKFVEISKYLS